MRITNLVATAFIAALSFSSSAAHANQEAQVSAASLHQDIKVISAISPRASSVSSSAGRFIGRGQPASYGRGTVEPDFRGMVKLSIRYEVGGGKILTEHCGGSVIDSRWIVTAAHCISPENGSRWTRIDIRTGDRDLAGRGTIHRRAHEAIIHRQFNFSTVKNDIALIRLKEPLPRTVVPAKLDRATRPTVQPGQILRTAGWPITGMKAGRQRLQTTDVFVTDDSYHGYIKVSSARGDVAGVCQGESGGPLISPTANGAQLVGLLSGIEPNTQNSSGEPCMVGGYEMYFTPIASHNAWIDKVVSTCTKRPESCSTRSASAHIPRWNTSDPNREKASFSSILRPATHISREEQ